MKLTGMKDIRTDNKKKDPKTTESYTGGEKSGLAVENRGDDFDDLINKARQNTGSNIIINIILNHDYIPKK